MNEVGVSPPGRVSVSFILPVLNRQHCIARAIDSCLACAGDRVEVRVLVIDGGSTDGTREAVASRYAGDGRVALLDQPRDRKGFMAACYFGVEQVRTDLASFMYSDDVLSPEVGRLAEALADHPETALAMGYGQQAAEDAALEFHSLPEVRQVAAERVLEAFYGRPDRLDGLSLPVSPVCCLVRSDALRVWARQVQEFVAGSALRQHAMIRLAGGQDLMVYLVAMLGGADRVLLADGVVAQLTASGDSITRQGNRAGQLLVGYWLGRVWGLNRALAQGWPVAAGMAGYVLAVWLYILMGMLRRLDLRWMPPVWIEGLRILAITVRHGLFLDTLRHALASGLARLRMRTRETN
ncbi:MAG TPA: glycosyltransferase [Thiobacillaceae bacterium]|nr:glycosyltransferase [Thiobacillaceae bacterium]